MASQSSSRELQEQILASANTLVEFEPQGRQLPSRLTDEDSTHKLIIFLRRYFGLSEESAVKDADTVEDVLAINGFFIRPVTLKKDRPSWQSNPILVDSPDGNNLSVLDTRSRQMALISLEDFAEERIHDPVGLADRVGDSGYEVYPLLPEGATSVRALIAFILPAIQADLIRSLALAIVLIAFALVSPLITGRVVGDVVPSGDLAWVAAVFVIGIILAVYQSAFSYLKSFYTARISNQLTLRLDPALFHRVLALPVGFLEQYTTGDLSTRLNSISSIVSTISSQSLATLLNSLSLLGYGGMMLYLDAGLSVPLFIYVFLSSIIQVLLVRRQLKLYRQSVPQGAENYDLTIETLSSIAQIRVSGNEPFFLQRWYSSLLGILRLNIQAEKLSDWNRAASSVLQTLGIAILYVALIRKLLGANSLEQVALGVSTFIVFTNAYSGFSNALLSLASLVNTVTGTLLVEIDRVLPLLRQSDESTAYFGDERKSLDGAIEFRDVVFSYAGAESSSPLFSGLNFDLKPGKFNVIFGPSGSGKSTILSLILGFVIPQDGSILIDGIPLNKLDIRAFRSQIGAVLQQSELTPGSILDAVTGSLETSEDNVWQALSLVNIAEEVAAMPMKLQTILSEGSSVISGGQRQRLCIARALLNHPRMLLEDEATSALDAYSQSVIIENLRQRSITRIVVAHRIATVRDCDHMVVINRGKVEASGTFQECLAQSSFLQEAVRGLSGAP
ncbi:ATP-binding cassette domain-containing protein [Synechococcus sp. CB0101]|uniref:peptidase domain-containing ABC transporter n=1 Tax=Synechococcus sp. CB0101 TaxID=232348 RepID=UPI0002F3D951|nr:ATP-binding cassette domain-containing protein [Synechococcus sp. CB0101]QCH15362.1 ATP-binding cassette domain-containing protein [Synechococcus sp. CB0101]